MITPKNWSSVILFMFPSRNKMLTPKLIENSQGIIYRFSWLNEKEVGEISKEWNYLVLEYLKIKMLKFFITQ